MVSASVSFRRASIVPLGSALKASSVGGAKTVKGPSPLRVSVRFAASIAVRRIEKFPASVAVSIISFSSAGSSNSSMATVMFAR